MPFKMWQGKYLFLIAAVGCTAFILLYSRFQSEISRLDEARKRLARTVASLQSQGSADERLPLAVLDDDATLQDGQPFARSNGQKSSWDDAIIIYNRVPKTGSTSFMGVAYDLCGKNGFNVLHVNTTKNTHVMSLSDQARFVHNVTSWNAKKPALYHGHVAFLDFGRFGVSQKPIYINIIRKPLDRLVSYYYFLRYGDDFRPYLVRRRQGDKMTFDECVEKQEKDCNPENMWLQVPFFCGHMAHCWIPGNEWALVQAKQNLVQHYLLVGVTEELTDFVMMLEATMPRFFQGATKHFLEGKKSHLRKTFNKVAPSSESVAKIQSTKIWQMENDFYEFALQQFHFARKRTLVMQNNNMISDRGQQFFYEKIRPK